VEIRATAAEVFYWLGDPIRAAEWMTSVSRTEIIERTSDWVGTTFKETVEEDGRGTEMRGVVVDFVANERMTFHLEGTFNTVDVTWTLEEGGQVTRVSQYAVLRFKGVLRVLSILFARRLKRKIDAQGQGELAELKRLSEGKIRD
jgi:uncharacterized protein YndB with AHSA1/START domain